MTAPIERMTATVGQFCKLSGMGKTKVFALIKNGTLQSIKVGATRLVVLDSYRQIIGAQTEPVHTRSRDKLGRDMGRR